MGEQITEEWTCGECGYSEEGGLDEYLGKQISRQFRTGRKRTVEREILVCPECESDDWHPESVRDALL